MVRMSLEEYIFLLSRCKYLGYKIGINMRILDEFSSTQVLSTYRVYSKFKRVSESENSFIDLSMAYKNVHKHVKKLESLGFIESVKRKDTKHGAIYYRISEAGMVQLFLRDYISDKFLPPILENHGNYSIFKTLLYPCFKKETLVEITSGETKMTKIPAGGRTMGFMFGGASFEIRKLINEYLRDCCKAIRPLTYSDSPIIGNPPGSKPRKDYLKILDNNITLFKEVLVMKILLYLRHPEETDRMNALSVLTQDEKFMNIAHDLQKDFTRSLDFAMHLRTRS